MAWLGAAAVAALIPVLILILIVLGVNTIGLLVFLFQHPIISLGMVVGTLGLIFLFKK